MRKGRRALTKETKPYKKHHELRDVEEGFCANNISTKYQ
jgi:hypothetical protein